MGKYKILFDIQFFGGRGASSGSGGGGAGGAGGGAQPQANAPATTPSGVSYDQFMQMSDAQKYQTMNDIINDPNIQVPDYLDGSNTTKVIYALGMNNKMTVVSDSQLDNTPGREIFRTVYESDTMPPPSSDAILDQIRNGDYTQMSDSGGSAHGKAIYFATDFDGSASYGQNYGWGTKKNVMIMRAKINPGANIRSEDSLDRQMRGDSAWLNSGLGSRYSPVRTRGGMGDDERGLYSIAHKVDGWYDGNYTMIVNRGNITASSQNKRITTTNRKGNISYNATLASDWKSAANAK